MEKVESAASLKNRETILEELQKIIKKEEKKNLLDLFGNKNVQIQ